LVDPDIYDGENPFSEDWLNEEVGKSPLIVENGAGEGLIIEQLVKVVVRILEFDSEAMSSDICWESRILLPKGINDADIDECDDEQ